MRFKRHMALENGLKEIYIAPLINIVFLLIIFFMLSSNFVMPSGIKVNLPRVLTSDMVREGSVEITISGENVTYINGKSATMMDIKNMIKQISTRANQAVLIKADKRASLGRAVEIWDLCRYSGITQVTIATDQQ